MYMRIIRVLMAEVDDRIVSTVPIAMHSPAFRATWFNRSAPLLIDVLHASAAGVVFCFCRHRSRGFLLRQQQTVPHDNVVVKRVS